MKCWCSGPGNVSCESLHHQVSKYETNQKMFVDKRGDIVMWELTCMCGHINLFFIFIITFFLCLIRNTTKHITYWFLIPLVTFRELSSSLVWVHLLAQILFEPSSDDSRWVWFFFLSLPKKHVKIHLECPKWYRTYLQKISHQIATCPCVLLTVRLLFMDLSTPFILVCVSVSPTHVLTLHNRYWKDWRRALCSSCPYL